MADNRLPKINALSTDTLDNTFEFIAEKNNTKYKFTTDDFPANSGVATVSGDTVDNTDPANPIVEINVAGDLTGDGSVGDPLTVTLPGIPDHNDTGSIQGGTTGEYYHMTKDEFMTWKSFSSWNDDFLGVLAPQWNEVTSYTDGTVSFIDTIPNGVYQVQMDTLGQMRELNWSGYSPYSIYRNTTGGDYFGMGLTLEFWGEINGSLNMYNRMVGLTGSAEGSELTVTNVVIEGSSPYRCNVTFSGAHGLVDNNLIRITGIVGVEQANGWFIVEKIDNTSVYLKNSIFIVGQTYSSGGSAYQIKDYILFTTSANANSNTHYFGLACGNNGASTWIYADDPNGADIRWLGGVKAEVVGTDYTDMSINFYSRNAYQSWVSEGTIASTYVPIVKLEPKMLFSHNDNSGGSPPTLNYRQDSFSIYHIKGNYIP